MLLLLLMLSGSLLAAFAVANWIGLIERKRREKKKVWNWCARNGHHYHHRNDYRSGLLKNWCHFKVYLSFFSFLFSEWAAAAALVGSPINNTAAAADAVGLSYARCMPALANKPDQERERTREIASASAKCSVWREYLNNLPICLPIVSSSSSFFLLADAGSFSFFVLFCSWLETEGKILRAKMLGVRLLRCCCAEVCAGGLTGHHTQTHTHHR